MSKNSTITATKIPLHVMLRRRRRELKLVQAEVAEAVHVSPECITLWEAGRRRMELSKLPRIAAVLQLDPKELCAKALEEFHPVFFAVLFNDCAVVRADLQQSPA
jgi:transcriptional regulator with XRE-family HTH domain